MPKPQKSSAQETIKRPRKAAAQIEKPSSSSAAASAKKNAAPGVMVTLRTDQGYEISFRSVKEMQQIAMKWRAVVRNRGRWTGNPAKREEQAWRAFADMKKALKLSFKDAPEMAALKKSLRTGLTGAPEAIERRLDAQIEQHVEREIEACIGELARAGVVEVSVPYTSEKAGWEARILPWEYLITAATHAARQGRPLTIIRHLDFGGTVKQREPKTLLLVESAPGRVSKAFDLKAEGVLMRGAVSDKLKAHLGIKGERSVNERPEDLRSKVHQQSPDIIHLAGVDTHQGAGLNLWKPADDKLTDGYLMQGEGDRIAAVEAGDLARMLNAGQNKPLLVACNIYHSAARIGAQTVANGAEAAIGFQDEFDEGLAELFFSNFYHAWRVSKWDLLAAFVIACRALRAQPRGLSGTGVVLWSRRSFLQPFVAAREGKAAAAQLPELERIEQEMRDEKSRVIRPDDADLVPDEMAARELLPVEIEPVVMINYAMLHNERPLFSKFLIHKLNVRIVNRVEVDVALQVGDQQAAYSASWDVVDSPLDLRDKIRLPLLSAAWASIGESARTTLSVRVKWGAHELYRQTHPVTLLTLDEWRDDDINTAWLPSFVLPRDPAVRRVIEAGQRYLMALRDDPSAGFDGYQSFEFGADDPALAAEDVDAQVRALWAAIVYDNTISYTNPPPTFTERSQRLRSPSEIFEAKRGTCIDTTLLLAACLELIEIYPVLFLLTGHAFVGYWRSDQYRAEFFKQLVEDSGSYQPEEKWESDSYKPAYAWYFEKRFYDAVLTQIREAKLVPLESTLLAMRGSFGAAVEQGLDNLRNRSEFHSMLDVVTAREHRVTPIPMRGR